MSEIDQLAPPLEQVEDLKAILLQLEEKRLKMARVFSLLFYNPHPKQQLFHAAAEYKFRLARTGNRFGKSTMGVCEDLAFALGERVWLPKNDPLRTLGIPRRPQKGLIVVADWSKVDEIFTGDGRKGNIGKIFQKLPKDALSGFSRNANGVIDNLTIRGLYGTSSITFDTRKSFESNPMGSESSDWDWIHVDEPIKEPHWLAISRGLIDRGGKAWFTCTLLAEPWINDFFLGDAVRTEEEVFALSREDRLLKWTLTGTSYDNTFLSKADIDDFADTLSEEEKQCRILGLPLHLSGLIFKQFQPERHVLAKPPTGWDWFTKPPRSYSIYLRIDPHPQTPHAVLFAAVSPAGHIIVYDEIFRACTLDELADDMLRRLDGHVPVSIKIDPGAWVPDPVHKTTFAHELAKRGFRNIAKGSKDLTRGIPVVNTYLAYDNPQVLWFSPTLRRTLYEINRYIWDPNNSNKPIDVDDHMMENLRRLLVDHPKWVSNNVVVPDYDLDIEDAVA